jgi:hypothetical protein
VSLATRTRPRRFARWAARHLGWPGAVGVLLLLAAAALAWGLRPWLVQSQQALLRQYVSQFDVAPSPASLAPQRDPRDAVRDGWPPATQAGDLLARLAALGARPARGETGIRQFQVGAPTHEALPPALLRVRVGMQFNARYADARALLAEVLNTLPNAALDTLLIEQRSARDPVLRCRVSWSLYFREVAP